MRKRLNTIIQIGHYPFDLMLSFHESDEQFIESLKKFGVYDINDPSVRLVAEMEKLCEADGRYLMFRGHQSVIRLTRFPQKGRATDMALLNHELLHAVHFFCAEVLNAPLNEDTAEVYAYLFQYLTEEIYKHI